MIDFSGAVIFTVCLLVAIVLLYLATNYDDIDLED